MIRVAFLFTFSKDYKGGINYLKNLLYATRLAHPDDVEFFIFTSTDIDNEYVELFSAYAKVIKTDLLKRHTLKWYVNKLFIKLSNRPLLMFSLLEKYQINVLSHSWFLQKNKSFKLLNWIPDFQNLHFPEMWAAKELKLLNKNNRDIINLSDAVVISSNDAFNDFKIIAPQQINKARILRFVAQPGVLTSSEHSANTDALKKKYGIYGKYFYLPNQFWIHKNHITVLRAIALLRQRGIHPILVTTGAMKDPRVNDENIKNIRKFIDAEQIDKQVFLLGILPYAEVLTLMRNCVAVINPSLFEGWSSTVEEAKSMGKTVILSNIGVHQEQQPQNAHYFDGLNSLQLADLMQNIWEGNDVKSNKSSIELAEDLYKRTIEFGEGYYNILKELTDTN